MKRLSICLFLLLATFAVAQEKPQPPAISVKLTIKLVKTQMTFEAAQQAREQAFSEWKAACGTEFQPGQDADGVPVCVEKPKSESVKQPEVK
jgi:hypothetical protein